MKNEVPLPNIEKIIESLNQSKAPVELEFFVGEEDEIFQNKVAQLVLNKDGMKFLQYLQSDI